MSDAIQFSEPSLPLSRVNTVQSLCEAAIILHRQWDETHDAQEGPGPYDPRLQEVIETVAAPLSVALDHLTALASAWPSLSASEMEAKAHLALLLGRNRGGEEELMDLLLSLASDVAEARDVQRVGTQPSN